MNYLKVLSIGSYTPENKVSNDDLSKVVDTSDEWIKSRTGIASRRIAVGEDTSELAYKASVSAIENSSISADEIDLIIAHSTAPDYHTPSVACRVQGMIGAKNAVAFDISAACTGMMYAMKIANQFAQDSKYKNILIVCSEVLSKAIDWNDRNTCVLFGDGASAMLLQNSQEEKGIISVDIFSDGSMGDALVCRTRDLKNLLNEEIYDDHYIRMDGRKIFKFATSVICEGISDVLQKNNVDIEDIKYIVPHQANIRMIDYAAKKLNIDKEKFYVNLQEYGNTSSASVGIALHEMSQKGLLNKGDKIILIAFGGGLTWGYSLVEW